MQNKWKIALSKNRKVKGDNMSKVKFSVACTAVYQSELEIPNEIKNDYKAILEYIHSHLNECNVDELVWLNDLDPEDAVTMEDIKYVE